MIKKTQEPRQAGLPALDGLLILRELLLSVLLRTFKGVVRGPKPPFRAQFVLLFLPNILCCVLLVPTEELDVILVSTSLCAYRSVIFIRKKIFSKIF